MKLYLDDDSASLRLTQLLRKAGHDVQIPADVGLRGRKDPVHLRHAIGADRICVTKNYKDFEELHLLVLGAQGHHPGIWVVRNDNNPKRDLDAPGIVRAIAKLLAAKVPIADDYIILNHWR
jgi:predicted nuclease of predicted toxin-antitoxin system